MGSETYYVTTPLYYVNDVPHIGHAYSTVGADVMARYQRACGKQVLFATGTDEHGTKIEKSAKEKGYPSPKALADEVVTRFQELWAKLEISYDDFIRTTQERHHSTVQKVFEKVYQAGYIEKRVYRGWYCVHEETFWPESQLVEPGHLCPDCKRPTTENEESNYFFKQSAFQQQIKQYLLDHPEFVSPEIRRNELLGSYLDVENGVPDQSITRANLRWGIPTPTDPNQVVWVWFDALSNYITVAGYEVDEEKFKKFWPADVHVIGKDILRFHAVLWPAMLMALGLPLPKKVFGTGLILNHGQKMSKSLGNAVDPSAWADQYGVEVLRYYLLREVPFGSDGSISKESIEKRYNTELANDLGNLLNRTLKMVENYCASKVPRNSSSGHSDSLAGLGKTLWQRYQSKMEELAFHEALEEVFGLVREANRYIDEKSPWKLAKDPSAAAQEQLGACLYNLLESLRLVALALAPFMPQTAEKILQQLGLPTEKVFGEKGALKGSNLQEAMQWGRLEPDSVVSKGIPLFPRLESSGVKA